MNGRPERLSASMFSAPLPIFAGLAILYVPTILTLARTIWATDEQGHGPIVLAVATWLTWQRRKSLAALPRAPVTSLGAALFVLGLLVYVLGRSQSIDTLEVGSFLLIAPGLLLLVKGWRGVRLMAFPLFFVLFMIPLPGLLVQTMTTPLKAGASYAAEHILYALGYPVARSGVMLFVAHYRLLVADACAGLNSMFTLEALGLLYLNVMRYTSPARNVALALLTIPVAFSANVIRVIILILVTFYLGDAAGQGFLHGFAGLVLFVSALLLILLVDNVLGLFPGLRNRPGESPAR
ncbi:MAG: exosortase B [Burkholderiaceae bacterium]|nr:exosortase B [Burkholderiaceae bacterium]